MTLRGLYKKQVEKSNKLNNPDWQDDLLDLFLILVQLAWTDQSHPSISHLNYLD